MLWNPEMFMQKSINKPKTKTLTFQLMKKVSLWCLGTHHQKKFLCFFIKKKQTSSNYIFKQKAI